MAITPGTGSTKSVSDAAFDSNASKTFLGHPRGLFLLFLVEMWERFSYYGMRALLVLYLISTIAVHQLSPGVHTNILDLRESTVPADAKAASTFIGSQSRTVHVVVGDAAGASLEPAADAVPQQAPSLKLYRLKEVDDPKNKGAKIWVRDETPGVDPMAIVVKGTANDKKSFANAEFAYEISNPTDQPIKLEAKMRPDEKKRTFFTLNDNPGTLSLEIKPDAKRTADDKPVQLVVHANVHDSGRNWDKADASVLYGWYTGLAYLFPIIGGLVADKLIGTHRSMLIGGILIAIGHIILGISGLGGLAQNATGMSLFMMGLAVIVLGTGHFKPTVSVMVGQLYKQGDPRRDGAFTIFYMGINLGAFLCAFVCGTLGEKVGWHWGFGSAAAGMLAGLLLYLVGKPVYLKGIGDAPRANAGSASFLFLIGCLVVSAAFGGLYYAGVMDQLNALITRIQSNQTLSVGLMAALLVGILAWVGWFLASNRPEDRGPVITIFVFMLFNAFFWIAFEQAGSSINVFTEQNTNRMIGNFEVPATWFQSINAGFIFIMAPLFSWAWTALGKKRMNPGQPVKIALGLIFLGVGYLFMVVAGKIAFGGAAKAGMYLIVLTYFWHTVGELCLSPTGLSYVTKAAPVKFVSLLMGIWFISSFIANLGGGLIAAQVEAIEQGRRKLPWQSIKALNFGGQADFFFLFVVTSIGAGVLILVLTPLLKKLMRNPND